MTAISVSLARYCPNCESFTDSDKCTHCQSPEVMPVVGWRLAGDKRWVEAEARGRQMIELLESVLPRRDNDQEQVAAVER